MGHAQKGGAGVEGKVTKIAGNVVYITNDAGKTYKGPLKNTAIIEISGVDSLKPNDPHTPEDEAEKDAADDVMEASPKKKGGSKWLRNTFILLLLAGGGAYVAMQAGGAADLPEPPDPPTSGMFMIGGE